MSCDRLRTLIPGMTEKTDKATVFEFAAHYIAYLRSLLDHEYTPAYDKVKNYIQDIITARKRSLRRLCFYRCLSFCPQGGCVWLLWGGHAWLLPGGMHGCSRGACVVALGWGGVRGLLRGGVRGFFDEIRSMSGWYASYWNAFLFKVVCRGRFFKCVRTVNLILFSCRTS